MLHALESATNPPLAPTTTSETSSQKDTDMSNSTNKATISVEALSSHGDSAEQTDGEQSSETALSATTLVQSWFSLRKTRATQLLDWIHAVDEDS